MPVLYEYLGLVIHFYSDEHDPIHVHVEYGNCESIAELVFDEEENLIIQWREDKGNPLPPAQLRKANKLLEAKKKDIVKKWVSYFVFHKGIKKQRITRKL
jgi:hypothetical protein